MRVGIATGLVVVGDLIGSGEAQERGVVGETPNLAARLQAIAEPNTVVIAEGTRRLLGNLFELQDLGGKGPQGHRRAGAGLGGAAREFGGRPLRGAARERPDRPRRAGRRIRIAVAALVQGEDGAKATSCSLSGEAGIGKSRLTAALLEHLASEPHTRLRYFCSPQHTDSALYPIIGQMERAAGLAHDDAPQSEARQARRGARADLDLARTPRSSPRCCRCRMMDAIRRSIWPRTSAGRERWKRCGATRGDWRAAAGADDLGRCALDRPHEPGSVRSDASIGSELFACC